MVDERIGYGAKLLSNIKQKQIELEELNQLFDQTAQEFCKYHITKTPREFKQMCLFELSTWGKENGKE